MAMDAADLADKIGDELTAMLERHEEHLEELREVLKDPAARISEELERSLQRGSAFIVGAVGAIRALDEAIDAEDEGT